MTEEQELIEILKKFKNGQIQRDKLERGRNGGWKIGDIYKLLELNPAIETVLSMLKENSAEIEQKNTELAEKNAEIEKKDKIIYEMIDSLIDLGFGFEYCNNDDRCINDCDKCIKQYFERKAKSDK